MTKTKKLSSQLLKISFVFFLFVFNTSFSIAGQKINKNSISPVSLKNLYTGGELGVRINKNFDRLEEERYQPSNVFLTDAQSWNWPGDTEGRAMLGLIMDAQASHRDPKYLDEIIRLIPSHLNSKGYMGTIQPDGNLDEQQLAGNGWMLRALCEYYKWKRDPKVLEIIKSISQNLFVSGKGRYCKYPIENNSRKMNGAVIGAVQYKSDGWNISGDVGCVFIGMTGAIQAYECIGGTELKSVIQEMVDRFMQVDMVGLKIQTHACLYGLLGIARWYEITGDKKYLDKLEKSWLIYKQYGMTENYEIYNWFQIYDSWTESCGLIDSYILASELWRYTSKPFYLAESERIYYNGICHIMRSNGGFGCDNCPSSKVNSLKVYANEAWWCCTMRGGEGLSRVAENSYFVSADTLFVTRYGENHATVNFDSNAVLNITQKTDYPFSNKVIFILNKLENAKKIIIKFNALTEWAENFKISINGKNTKLKKENGFFVLGKDWKQNDEIVVTFDQKIRLEPAFNKENCSESDHKLFHGSLLWGALGDSTITIDKVSNIKQVNSKLMLNKKSKVGLTPLYHLLDSTVKKGSYSKQFLFKSK